MFASKILIAGFIALASTTSLHSSDVLIALLQRQAPGTPSYNCHDNCGTAIALSRQPNKYEIEAFKTNYNNCLKCAGPDNYNIWRMYGNTLSGAGASCRLKTEPVVGKQDDVGPAVHAGSSSSGAVPATPVPAGTTASASSVVAYVTSNATSSISAASSGSRNAMASVTSSAPAQQSMNASARLTPAGMFGAVVVGTFIAL